MSVRVAVVSAGLSQPSTSRMLAEQIANAVSAQVSARGEAAEVEFIELRELAQELATTMVTGGLPTPAVAAARDVLANADALVAVSPTFTASYSGLFKMFFDVLDPDTLRNVPTIVGATAGTARHSLVLDFAMRPLFTYLHALVVPTGVFAATEDFGGGADGAGLAGRVRQAASELVTQVMQAGSAVGGFVQSDADLTRRVSGNQLGATPDFASLLKGHAGSL
ncbi:CE1759 family FMN reductase [Galactobacter caseinivorans]|uniref:Oxidoreductase n=1 Tax=Galactobacter caseinivorans TaxID=2676123 RepID=A0A496PFM8_9MICC|nr:CE1759 family FMN reductase [Galactobacter caseinivorans]RKW69552.1 oxidoreductase [Galactobacter caseinivorans]